MGKKRFKIDKFDVTLLDDKSRSSFYSSVEKEWQKVHKYAPLVPYKDPIRMGSSIDDIVEFVLASFKNIYQGDSSNLSKNVEKSKRRFK